MDATIQNRFYFYASTRAIRLERGSKPSFRTAWCDQSHAGPRGSNAAPAATGPFLRMTCCKARERHGALPDSLEAGAALSPSLTSSRGRKRPQRPATPGTAAHARAVGGHGGGGGAPFPLHVT